MGSDRFDMAVVGAGIVGLAVAREVLARRPDARLIVIDKHASVGQQQTGHNSGVIHAGMYYSPGSLKARLCVAGSRLMREFCDEHEVPHERCGKLIVAVREDELGRLDDIEARGHANGVPGLRRVEAAEIADIEPECRGIAALHSPGTGIVDFAAVARAMERELRAKGVRFALGCEITAIRRRPGGSAGPARPPAMTTSEPPGSPGGERASTTSEPVGRPGGERASTRRTGRGATVLFHAAGTFEADAAIVCAGLWSDRLAVSAGAPADPRVIPFRGAYLRLAEPAPPADPVVRGLVYPVPDPALPFLGVHVTRHIDGGVLLGPTALLVAARDVGRPSLASAAAWRRAGQGSPGRPAGRAAHDLLDTVTWPGTWSVARTFWRTGISELAMAASRGLFVRQCARYVPAVAAMATERGTVRGVRAQAVGRDGRLVDDFTISHTPGATHVRNAPSPAATSSLALASEIVDRFEAASE